MVNCAARLSAARFRVYGFFWLLNASDAELTDRMTIGRKEFLVYENIQIPRTK